MNKHMHVKAQQSVKWASQNKKRPSEAYGHWVKSVDTKKYQEAHNKKYNIKPGDDDYYEPDNTWPWTESVGDAEGSEEGWKYMHANVSKSAFGVDHEISKLVNPVSAAGKAIAAIRKPAAAGKHANVAMSTADRAGNIAHGAPKSGQTSAARMKANRPTGSPPPPSPRVTNPVAMKAAPPSAASMPNAAPSSGTQTVHLNNGNAGPAPTPAASTPKKRTKGKNGKNGGGFTEWAKTNSWQRNAAIGAGIGGVGAMGYGAAKLGGRD